MKPQPYDFTKRRELNRWFNEMKGYLRTDDFLNQGTDREGRKFALEGLNKIEELLKICYDAAE